MQCFYGVSDEQFSAEKEEVLAEKESVKNETASKKGEEKSVVSEVQKNLTLGNSSSNVLAEAKFKHNSDGQLEIESSSLDSSSEPVNSHAETDI